MGHRIHVLSYDPTTKQVDVKLYLDRHGRWVCMYVCVCVCVLCVCRFDPLVS
jgi:hypothetical protein